MRGYTQNSLVALRAYSTECYFIYYFLLFFIFWHSISRHSHAFRILLIFSLSSSYVLLVQTPNFSFRPRLERTPSINFITRIYFSTSSALLFFFLLFIVFVFSRFFKILNIFFLFILYIRCISWYTKNCSYKGWKVYMHTAYSTHIRSYGGRHLSILRWQLVLTHNERREKKLLRREIPNRRQQQQHQRKIRGEWEESKNKKT